MRETLPGRTDKIGKAACEGNLPASLTPFRCLRVWQASRVDTVIRLIATDLDGTLVNSARLLDPRTLEALTAARDAGLAVVPASGRQPFSIAEVLSGSWLAEGIVIGANGAVGVDLATDDVLFETVIEVEAQTRLFHELRQIYPKLACVSIRDAGATFWPEEGYVGMMDPGDHGREEVLKHYPLEEVLGEPSVKLVLRGADVAPEEVRAVAEGLGVPGVKVSTSGAPFVEVAAEGVNKASGLQKLCARLGIAQDEVLAFGDNNNDLEMIGWAGHGVAMGNALPELAAVADEVTLTNNEFGVAVVVERLATNGWSL